MLNLKEFAQDTPLKGIKSDYFYAIMKDYVTTDDNGTYLNSRSNKKVYAVGSFNDGELQNVKIVHQNNDGTYFYNLEMNVIMRLSTLMQRKYIP